MFEEVMNTEVYLNNKNRQNMEGYNTEFQSSKIYMQINFMFVFLQKLV